MIESSGLSESQESIVDAYCRTDKEVMLLTVFRVLSDQRQQDLLRLAKVFEYAPE